MLLMQWKTNENVFHCRSSVGLGRNGRESMAVDTSCCVSSRPMRMSSTALKASPWVVEELFTASQRELVEMVDLLVLFFLMLPVLPTMDMLVLGLNLSTHTCLSLASAALTLYTSPELKLMEKVWLSSSLGIIRAPSISCLPLHFPSFSSSK